MENKIEHCSTCEKQKDCLQSRTLWSYQPPVPCVHYQKESDTKVIYLNTHNWETYSSGTGSWAHMCGVSSLSKCKTCGVTAPNSLKERADKEHKCSQRIITKIYKVGGKYAKET